jgi:hypothetical protein
MGKSREPQIILKADQRNVIFELGLGENSKQNQATETRTEPSSKALFWKLNTQWPRGANPRSGWTAPGTASGPALFSDRGVTASRPM